jgi:hypothetical protein
MATTDLKKKEMDFHNTYIREACISRGCTICAKYKDENQDTSGITFHDNVKAPLSMHETLVEIPRDQRKVDSMKIDFQVP